MDVTTKNFKEVLPKLEESISNAKFITIDSEFTGVNSAGNTIHGLDTPSERYQKARMVAQNYMILQYGICTFSWDEEQSKYLCQPYNFYIFPYQFSKQAPDRRFMCQSSCINFLISQGFDFNKTFKEGISYLIPAEEHKLRDALEEKHRSIKEAAATANKTPQLQLSSPAFTSPQEPNAAHTAGKGPPEIPEEHQEFINNFCNKIVNFKSTEEKELELPPYNGFIRKLIYLTVAQKFSNDVYVETRTNEKKMRHQVIVKVGSEQEMQEKEAQKRAKEVQELDDAVGFTKVIKMISHSGKLIVGHNMLLDLLYTINQFLCPLPEDYEEFKALIKCLFPRLLDTKWLTNTLPLKDLLLNTTLTDLEKATNDAPFKDHAPVVECSENHRYDTSSEKLHEAGYDAYITGKVLTVLANYLGTFQKNKPTVVFPDSQLLQPHLNKLYIMRVYDVPFMNLGGEDLPIERGHVFHLTFPSEWKTADLVSLFSPFGNVQISWLDDVSAYVSLYNRENTPYVLQTLNKGLNYRILTYEDFKNREKNKSMQSDKSVLDHVDQAVLSSTPVSSNVTSSSNKRKFMPTSDVDLPPKEKRRRSRNSVESPFSSNRSITTIVEEAEEEEVNHHVTTTAAEDSDKTLDEDLGEPMVKKLKRTEEENESLSSCTSNLSAISTGLFEVPDW